jgi:ice-binding like protein/type IX secretion system substrate protein
MKNKVLLFILTTIAWSSQILGFAQAPSLGAASNFVLFTTAGAVGSTGISNITGNVGTNSGAITGFGAPTIMVGVIDSGNALTAQASTDLAAAYTQLYNTVPTSTTHTPAFGGGETLFAGVYAIAAAGSIAGTLNLDAQGNPNAVFIFKFGGAFTTGASSTINLINGAMACNIFWGAEGAIAMAAGTIISGTLISNNGAVSMGAGGVLNGSMLSTTGAVSVYGVTIPLSGCLSLLPVDLLSFTAACNNQHAVLNWSTVAATNNNYFTAERSSDGIQWQTVGTVAAQRNPGSLQSYTLTDSVPGHAISYYRLKQTDFNGNYKYGDIIYIEKCGTIAAEILTVYPNPSAGIFELLFSGNRNEIYSTEIFNSSGQKVYKSSGFQSKLDLSAEKPGIYFIQIHLYSKIINREIILEK